MLQRKYFNTGKKPAPRSKLYFGVQDNKNKIMVHQRLTDYTDENGEEDAWLKSFSSYEYNDKTYFNIYLQKEITKQTQFDKITKELSKIFSTSFQYTYKDATNAIMFKTEYDKTTMELKKYPPKIYFSIDKGYLDDILEILKKYKKKYNNFKSYSSYTFNEIVYVNIIYYDDCCIDDYAEFMKKVYELNKLFEEISDNGYVYKYKNNQGELLYNSNFSKPLVNYRESMFEVAGDSDDKDDKEVNDIDISSLKL